MPKKEAAPEATQGPTPGGAVGIVDQDRLDLLDALAEKATAQYGGQEPARVEPPAEPKVERELVNQPKDPATGRFLPKDPEAKAVEPPAEETAPAPEAVAEVAPEAPTPAQDPMKALITRKVNGVDVTKTVEEWISAAQKIEAADRYLAESAKLYKTNPQHAGPQAQAPAETPSKDSEIDFAAVTRAIQTGTEEEGRDALAKLYARLNSQPRTPQPEQLAQVLQPMVWQQLDHFNALQTFNSEYKDVIDDPNLFELMKAENARLLQANYQGSNLERLRAAGQKVRDWRNSLTGQAVTEKQQRKATVTVIPTAAARAAGKTEEKPESAADVIAEMARQRQAR